MAKNNGENREKNFRHHGENGEKIDGKNGKKINSAMVKIEKNKTIGEWQ